MGAASCQAKTAHRRRSTLTTWAFSAPGNIATDQHRHTRLCKQTCIFCLSPAKESAVGQTCCVDHQQLVLDRNLPEVDPLDEGPVEALCHECGDEVLLYPMLHILQTSHAQCHLQWRAFAQVTCPSGKELLDHLFLLYGEICSYSMSFLSKLCA